MLTRRQAREARERAARKAAQPPKPAQPEYTDEQLDIYALKAFLQATGRIRKGMTKAERKQIIMPYHQALRPMFKEDSVGFRTFLIMAAATGLPDDTQTLQDVAKVYLQRAAK